MDDEATDRLCKGGEPNELTHVVVESMSGEVVIETEVDLITCTTLDLKRQIEGSRGFNANTLILLCGQEQMNDAEVLHAYIDTPEIARLLMVVQDRLAMELSADQMGDRIIDPISTLDFGHYAVTEHQGVKVLDLDRGHLKVDHSKSGSLEIGDEYAHCCWIFWREGDDGFRSVLAGTFANGSGSNDHAIIVNRGTRDLGIHCNRSGGHIACGHTIDVTKWNFVCVVGKKHVGTQWSGFEGRSEFFVATPEEEHPRSVGVSSRVASGSKLDTLGYAGGSPHVGPGKLAFLKCWNRSLTEAEIAQVFFQTVHMFK